VSSACRASFAFFLLMSATVIPPIAAAPTTPHVTPMMILSVRLRGSPLCPCVVCTGGVGVDGDVDGVGVVTGEVSPSVTIQSVVS